MFCRYSLRTTNVEEARRFYLEAVGLDIPLGGTAAEGMLEVWPLHERARANGAPSHWLGHLATDDIDATVRRLVEHGSERLGPTVRAGDGATFATLRDPDGAVITVREVQERIADDCPIAWHHLHSKDANRAWAMYSALFGWCQTGTVDVPDPQGAAFGLVRC